jgi:predicted nuclease of restriction endonuclease-like (RecB) superfamily
MKGLNTDIQYEEFLLQVKDLINSSQVKIDLSIVNDSIILMFWNLGKAISEKQKEKSWGNTLMTQLAKDLRTESTEKSCFSSANLLSIRNFYLFYTSKEITQAINPVMNGLDDTETSEQDPAQLTDIKQETVSFSDEFSVVRQLVTQIPWNHHKLILNKVKDPKAAIFYIQQTIENNWKKTFLGIQIEQNLFERHQQAVPGVSTSFPDRHAPKNEQIIRDPYDPDRHSFEPTDTEEELMLHLTKFLVVPGKGFAFVAQQYHFEMGDKDYYIDLIFYHIRLHCFVVIELKEKAFKPEFADKLNFYLSVVDNLLKAKNDQPAIGILICKNNKELTVDYFLPNINQPIENDNFTITDTLPDDLKMHLQTKEEFEIEFIHYES